MFNILQVGRFQFPYDREQFLANHTFYVYQKFPYVPFFLRFMKCNDMFCQTWKDRNVGDVNKAIGVHSVYPGRLIEVPFNREERECC